MQFVLQVQSEHGLARTVPKFLFCFVTNLQYYYVTTIKQKAKTQASRLLETCF